MTPAQRRALAAIADHLKQAPESALQVGRDLSGALAYLTGVCDGVVRWIRELLREDELDGKEAAGDARSG